MEFTIKRDVFLEGIQKTLGIVEKKATVSIMNNLLIRTKRARDQCDLNGARIEIVATDMEIGLVADYEADIVREGDITLSARKLYEMVREIQGEMIHVSKSEKDVVTMTCEKVVYRIPGIPADDYPLVANRADMPFCRIKGNILREMIRKTSFAMSTDEMRRNLNGVLLEAEQTGETPCIRMVATDGYRLSVIKMDPGEKDFSFPDKGIIIPRKGLGEIRKLVEDEPEELFLGIDPGVCIIKTDHTLLRVSLIDWKYPDYRRIIPAEEGISLQMDKDKIFHALRRMSVISSENYNSVMMTLSKGMVVLNSTNPDVGEANEEIEVVYQGEERSFSYNIKYLMEAIDVIDEERVAFEISEGKGPGVIRAVGNENYFCIVMPLKN